MIQVNPEQLDVITEGDRGTISINEEHEEYFRARYFGCRFNILSPSSPLPQVPKVVYVIVPPVLSGIKYFVSCRDIYIGNQYYKQVIVQSVSGPDSIVVQLFDQEKVQATMDQEAAMAEVGKTYVTHA